MKNSCVFLTFAFIIIQGEPQCQHGWKPYDTSCYLVVSTNKTWSDAQSFCQITHHAYLAELEMIDENKFLLDLLLTMPSSNKHNFWLGANDINTEGTFIWSTSNHEFDITDWGPHEPNGHKGENCLDTRIYDDGKLHWNDHSCDLLFYFVCEKSIGGSGGSSIIG
ncbi:low affinity immunoglobulin epsilon Fc receptor [Mytilus galloprovincialis]|uniref:Low affinity immunoglobulin epsilon Fc receptor n=1 Tax=Mytilus galloprovincialis TaxID=29158 RepID=A0A8B6DWK7_MYTGA|nr:low affinity immunoglobulin epsilon Fc receptor [Mytilus galloprovincialis]